MGIKFIAIDIDGTLITPDKRITTPVREALKYAERKGVMVSLITGRLYPTCKKYSLELGISGPCIIYQGAMIIDPHSDEILQEIRVPKRVALEIIDYSRENHLALNVYMDQYTFYTENPNEYSVLDAQLNEVDLQLVEDIKRIVTKDPLKLMFVGEPQLISNLELLFASKDNSYSATTSLPQFLEIVGKKATKKDALQWVSRRFGIKQEEIMAIGDSHNDISMIEWAGIGVAMGNADEKVKKAADFVTLPNTEDGVAYAIKRFI